MAAQLEKTYANNAIRAYELDQLVGGGAGGVSLGISAEVAEVTNVALLIGGGTVVLATGVDWKRTLAWWSVGLAVSRSPRRFFYSVFLSMFSSLSCHTYLFASSPPLTMDLLDMGQRGSRR